MSSGFPIVIQKKRANQHFQSKMILYWRANNLFPPSVSEVSLLLLCLKNPTISPQNCISNLVLQMEPDIFFPQNRSEMLAVR